jgi:4-aminobutyrate aminotransferase-like enzyme
MTSKQKILELNAFNMRDSGGLDSATAELIERRRRTFGPTSMLFYKKPLNLVRGEGVWLYDADGTRYLDGYNNVPSVGHCHPKVVEAVAKQMAILNTHTRYLCDIVYTYAEELLATFPGELSNVVLTCTGSESVDLALRIARNVTGGTGFIATENAYHGNTTTATEISAASASGEARPRSIYLVPAPDTYRHPKDAGRRFVRAVETAIEEMHAAGIRLAGFIADSAFSSDGVYVDKPGFLAEVAEVVRKNHGLYIADEVQPGFSRLGDSMWGFERHGVIPDLVVMGKPMGNGYPIGATVAKPDLLEAFGSKCGYFNTFGGSPVAAAAGLAVLQILKEEGLQKNAKEAGKYFLNGLRAAAKGHDCVGDIRGAGLYLGVEFVSIPETKEPDRAAAVNGVNYLRDHNILVGTSGFNGNIWKIRPPLCFSKENADQFVEGFAAVVKKLR